MQSNAPAKVVIGKVNCMRNKEVILHLLKLTCNRSPSPACNINILVLEQGRISIRQPKLKYFLTAFSQQKYRLLNHNFDFGSNFFVSFSWITS